MGQIIKNYVFIFIFPFLIGAAVRFLGQRAKKAYFVTAVFIALAVIGWVIYYVVSAHGSEWYGIVALLATGAAAGALTAGLVLRLKRNGRR